MKWYQIELYLTLSKIQILKTLTYQSDLDNQDKEFRLFCSNPLQFQSFWEIFDSSIHSNTSPASINKFSYLKTLLTGKTKDTLNSLELSSGNYDKALAILKSRFGDPQVVILSNIDILLALHPVSGSCNITELCKIYNKVETVSRNLRFEVHAEHFGLILIAVLMKKSSVTFAYKYLETCLRGSWKFQNY